MTQWLIDCGKEIDVKCNWKPLQHFKIRVTWTEIIFEILTLAIVREEKQERQENKQLRSSWGNSGDNGGQYQNDASGDERRGKI